MYIDEQQIRALLTYEALIPAIRQALIDYSAGLVDQPPRTILRSSDASDPGSGWFAVMPVIHNGLMGVKTVTFYPANAALGLQTHMAIIEVLRRSSGEPLAVMDGRLITEMRTAAVSAVAFAALAPLHFENPPKSLGILGSGVQAHAHIEALRSVWPTLTDIRIWSRTPSNAERLADQTSSRATSLEGASASQVVLTVTSALDPVLLGRNLASDALILAVGATGSTLREIDDEAMLSSFIVAESRSCVERESGDVRLSGARVQVEVGEILANPSSAAIPRSGRILFKTVGMAIEDLAAASLVWQARNAPGTR